MPTTGKSQNRELLVKAARMLGPVLEDLVFVGGCATALLITDEAAGDVRPTFDVDAITKVSSYAQYNVFSQRLRDLGFHEDQSEGSPLCRWRNDDVILDVMPVEESILGFSNRWYNDVIQTAACLDLEPNVTIRVVTAPYFVATKLEAFNGRGKADLQLSQDLEDLVCGIDGRSTVIDEINSAGADLSKYIASEIRGLLNNPDFLGALPGFLLPDAASQRKIAAFIEKA